MSDHSFALVPLGSGYVQSTDVFARGRPVDTGLLAEALIYYDSVLICVENPVQFSQLISWLVQQGLSVSNIVALFRDGTFGVYDFAFTTNPYVNFESPDGIQIHGLYNFQDATMQQPNSFSKRFLEFVPLRDCFENSEEFDEFVSALEGRVVEVKADEIGSSAIDNAYKDFLSPKRSALMAQQLVDEIYRIKLLGNAPQVSVEVQDLGGGEFRVNWSIPLNQLPALEAETNIKAAVTIPLSTAAQANKYLWAADKLKCDLYLARPVSALVGDKLFEAAEIAVKSSTKTRNVIEDLQIRVEFPDLRRHVNLDKIDFNRILEIRKKSKRFRDWLQAEGDRDRDAIIAYHHEVAKESGFSNAARRTWKAFGVLGGAAVGASVVANPSTGAAVGVVGGAVIQTALEEAVKSLFDLSASVGKRMEASRFLAIGTAEK